MDQLDPLPRRIAWFAPWTWKRRWWIVAALFLLPATYILSSGPMTALALNGLFPLSAYQWIYAPIMWLMRVSPAFAVWPEWYAELFLRIAPPTPLVP